MMRLDAVALDLPRVRNVRNSVLRAHKEIK